MWYTELHSQMEQRKSFNLINIRKSQIANESTLLGQMWNGWILQTITIVRIWGNKNECNV